MPNPIEPGDPVVAPPRSGSRAQTPASLGSAVRVVSLLTIGSRIGGLIRDVATVRVFGDTWIGSAFAAAFAVPNMFRRLFGEGALSAAFIPPYAALDRDDPAAAARFASRTMRLLVLVTVGATLLAEIGIALLLWLLPPEPERVLSLRLLLLLMPFMPMVCSTAILGAMLQVHGRFAPGAAAPILLNLCIVLAALPFFFSDDGDPIATAYIIGAATLVAGAAQVAWTLAALRRHVRWTRDTAGTGEPMRALGKRFGPVVVGLGTIQLNSLIDTFIAMWPVWVGATMFGMACPLDGASNSILTYTQRLYQFPLGVFGIAVATAAFPMLARAAGDGAAVIGTLRRAMRLSLFIGVPASVGLLLVGPDLIGVLYGRGEGGTGFSADGAARSAAVLAGYGVSVWAYSLNHVSTRAFYARGDTATPMRVAMGIVGLNLALNLSLIWWLREAGLAWATGISAVVQCVVLLTILARRHRTDLDAGGAIIDAATARGIGRIVLATAIMGAAVWIGLRLAGGEGGSWWWRAGRLAAGVGLGGLVYGAVVLAGRAPEVRWLLERPRVTPGDSAASDGDTLAST
ncbi:MAG: murein biosynthesis integral membrane protein MurJ [Phycisphaerales bacterium]